MALESEVLNELIPPESTKVKSNVVEKFPGEIECLIFVTL